MFSALVNIISNVTYSGLKISLSVALAIFLTDPLLAAKTDSLFQSDEVVVMELRSDFSAIQIDRADNPEYHDGELIYYTSDGIPVNLPVKVMARGNFRRDPDNCNFPPLFVNFKKKEVANTLFDNQDKLKLVTPCQKEDDLLKEYIVYKMYNRVTEQSLKVRLVRILYFDTGSSTQVFDKYSFFIEDKDHLAERNNAIEKDAYMTPFNLERENIGRVATFQYLIGHRDWFVTTRHNIILMQPNDSSLAPFAVPYDFDFSAFVNADYSRPAGVPDALLPDRRIYKGICYTADEFNGIFELYRELRPEFESVIDNMNLISRSSKRQIHRYIKYFYSVIESSELISQEFLATCETKEDYNIIDE